MDRITFPKSLHWIIRHVGGKQTRENVYGEDAAVKRLLELGDRDAYIWTPGAYAIDFREASNMARGVPARRR